MGIPIFIGESSQANVPPYPETMPLITSAHDRDVSWNDLRRFRMSILALSDATVSMTLAAPILMEYMRLLYRAVKEGFLSAFFVCPLDHNGILPQPRSVFPSDSRFRSASRLAAHFQAFQYLKIC